MSFFTGQQDISSPSIQDVKTHITTSVAAPARGLRISSVLYHVESEAGEAGDLMDMAAGLSETVATAQRIRRQKSGLLEDDEKSWIDSMAIAKTEQVLGDVVAMIEPPAPGYKASAIRDNSRINTMTARLGAAQQTLNSALVIMAGRGDGYISSMARPSRVQTEEAAQSSRPPAYSEKDFLQFKRRHSRKFVDLRKVTLDVTPTAIPELSERPPSPTLPSEPLQAEKKYFAGQMPLNSKLDVQDDRTLAESGSSIAFELDGQSSRASPQLELESTTAANAPVPAFLPRHCSYPEAAGLEARTYTPYRPASVVSETDAATAHHRHQSLSALSVHMSMESLASVRTAPAQVNSPTSYSSAESQLHECDGTSRAGARLQHSRSRGKAWLYRQSMGPT